MECLLRQRDRSPDKRPVLYVFPYIGEARIVKNALRKDNPHAAAGLQQGKTTFDEQDFCFDAPGFLREVEQGSNRLLLGGAHSGNGFLIQIAIFQDIAFLYLIRNRYIGLQHHVTLLDIGPKRRIGEHDIEAFLKYSIYVDKAIVVMNASMTVAMHDHIHLTGPRHTVIRIATKDAPIS